MLLTMSIGEPSPNKSMTANLPAFLPYAYNGYHGLIMVSDYYGDGSPIDSVSMIMKLCDYHAAKNSKFIAYHENSMIMTF